MNRHPISLTLACLLGSLLCSSGAHAQLYKSVGADGRITYSDQPPASAVRTEKRQLTNSVVDSAGLPFELAQVTKASPVTLYTGNNCPPCAEARTLLNARGIPFTEKTVITNADITLVSGSSSNSEIELPQLQVGQSRLRGFDSTGWNGSLTAVGYPTTNTLPKTYKNPPAQPAATVVRIDNASAGAAEDAGANPRARRPAARPATPTPVAPNGETPPGFRF